MKLIIKQREEGDGRRELARRHIRKSLVGPVLGRRHTNVWVRATNARHTTTNVG
jgi:hypothetical protein